MHYPVEITIGPFKLLLHTLIEPLAFFIGFRYFLFLRRRSGDVIESDNRIWILIGAIFGAIAGSRLVGGLENPAALAAAPNKLLYFYENKTVLGGFLGGLAGVEIIKKLIGETKASGDLFVYPIILSLIIGRTGCFSMGVYEETYGLPTTLPWGMHLGDAALRHPVTLYEIAYLAFVWWLLRKASTKYTLRNGALFKLFMIAYCIFRFLLDFIKPHHALFLGWSSIQCASLAGILYYYRYILKPSRLTE